MKKDQALGVTLHSPAGDQQRRQAAPDGNLQGDECITAAERGMVWVAVTGSRAGVGWGRNLHLVA